MFRSSSISSSRSSRSHSCVLASCNVFFTFGEASPVVKRQLSHCEMPHMVCLSSRDWTGASRQESPNKVDDKKSDTETIKHAAEPGRDSGTDSSTESKSLNADLEGLDLSDVLQIDNDELNILISTGC